VAALSQDSSGGFQNSTCEESYGPYGTNTPDRAAPYRAGEVGTLATARAVGTLAYAAAVFRRVDHGSPTSVWPLLDAATPISAHGHREQRRSTCPVVRMDGDALIGRHVRMYSAAGMLPRDRRAPLPRRVRALVRGARLRPELPALQRLRRPSSSALRRATPSGRRLRQRIAMLAEERGPLETSTLPLGPADTGGPSARHSRAPAASAFMPASRTRSERPRTAQAMASVHYLLGRNYLQFCYVSGLAGPATPASGPSTTGWQRCGRSRTISLGWWPAVRMPSPRARTSRGPGAGRSRFGDTGATRRFAGPSTPFEQRFTDNDSWSTNEISL
jgi:hypothetical protein